MLRIVLSGLFFILVLPLSRPAPVLASESDGPIVRAVMFYSPMCPHCGTVKQQHLPGWFAEGLASVPTYYAEATDKYPPVYVPFELKRGRNFELLMINTYSVPGDSVWKAVGNALQLREPMRRIPFILMGDRYLKGAGDIPRFFPQWIEEARAAGGHDWPDQPEIRNVLARIAAYNQSLGGILQPPPRPDYFYYFRSEPLLSGLSALVLLWLLVQAALSIRPAMNWKQTDIKRKQLNALLLLAIAGLGISGYLSVAHLTDTSVACGDLSNCDRVSKSAYGSLFGLIPVAYIGFAGYLVLAWLIRGARERQRGTGAQVLVLASAAGLLFSVYLIATALFVIQATCLWCLGSAAVMAEINRRLR